MNVGFLSAIFKAIFKNSESTNKHRASSNTDAFPSSVLWQAPHLSVSGMIGRLQSGVEITSNGSDM